MAQQEILYEHTNQRQDDDNDAAQFKGVEIAKSLFLFFTSFFAASAVIFFPFPSGLVVICEPVFRLVSHFSFFLILVCPL